MNKTDLAVVGGFLGAGKTTSILNIARHLVNQGKKVGIVTNDQGSELVDTNFLIKSGLPVLEVTGGCFCCNFEEFTQKVNELSESLLPDIVLAEPVGSCTDLIATIFKPIQSNYTKQFSLAPLSIVVDPKRVKKLMMEDESSPFPSEINYLFQKQLEEADIIALNKIDTLPKEQINLIVSFLKDRFKGIDVITISAKDGSGVDKWVSMISSRVFTEKPSLDIDYAAYAAAEEYLGWLNSSVLLTSAAPHDANEFLNSFMEAMKNKLADLKFEIAHLKAYEICGSDFAKVSLTSIFDEADFNKKMDFEVSEATLIINARVDASPERLEPILREALNDASTKFGIALKELDFQCFKPGKPNPTHRMK